MNQLFRNIRTCRLQAWKSYYGNVTARLISEQTPSNETTEGETKLKNILGIKFPKAISIEVNDISGGCGALYEIYIKSDEFKGKRTVMQHRMVNEALEKEIKEMHGLRISTSIPGD